MIRQAHDSNTCKYACCTHTTNTHRGYCASCGVLCVMRSGIERGNVTILPRKNSPDWRDLFDLPTFPERWQCGACDHVN